MKSTYFNLCIFVLISLISLHSVQSDNCEERQAQAEILLRTILRLGRNDEKAITTTEGFKEYCKNAKDGLRLFKEYGQCVSGIVKQVFSIIKTTATKALRHHCVIDAKVSLDHLSCFKDMKLTYKYRKCLYKFGSNLNYAAEKAEENEIFSSICCGFNKLSMCLDNTFKNNGEFCTNPEIDLRNYAKTLLKGMFGSVMDTFCSSYTSDSCENQFSKMQDYSIENKNPVKIQDFSIVPSLIKLSEKLSA